MKTTGTETPEDARHTDTALVDELTAYLNSTYEPSGGDLMELVCQLISGSGRPLLDERWDFDAEVSEDRHGLLTGTVTAGRYTIRVTSPPTPAATCTSTSPPLTRTTRTRSPTISGSPSPSTADGCSIR